MRWRITIALLLCGPVVLFGMEVISLGELKVTGVVAGRIGGAVIQHATLLRSARLVGRRRGGSRALISWSLGGVRRYL
jgi:hypothetical protein